MSDTNRQDHAHGHLGTRLRRLRNASAMTLADVASRSGISTSTLSKVETGKVSPTFANLCKLAETLGVPLAQVIAHSDAESPQPPRARFSVTRRDEVVFTNTPSVDIGTLCPSLRKKRMSPFYEKVYPPTERFSDRLVSHQGEEFVYCLEGIIEIHTEYYEPFVLHPGDSAYLDSQMRHTYCSGRALPSHLLLVHLPPENRPDEMGREVVAKITQSDVRAAGDEDGRIAGGDKDRIADTDKG